jgi:hydrogenase maturation protein HypF
VVALLSEQERALLESPARPIVLLQRRESASLARAVAPDNPLLGIVLPCTPLHHLLLRALAETPLAITSANRRDEPMLSDDDEALETLRGIADLFLVHDRRIGLRCDDSIARVIGDQPVLLRRSRGYAPASLPLLSRPCFRPLLAVGGQQQATFALGQGPSAIVSHHLGDLGDPRAYRAYEAAIAHYESLLHWSPTLIVHDLHPGYASTIYARERSARDDVPLLAVQHHHAHLASCLAEHGVKSPVIGVTFDGTGHGTDGALWGGEFLLGDCGSFERAAQLRYVALPGGEWAAREPWRAALAHLVDAEACDLADPLFSDHVPESALRTVTRMIERHQDSPLCSSMGRLFDAVAALLRVRLSTTFEGQATLDLEFAAQRPQAQARAYPFDLSEQDGRLVVDTRPLVQEIAADAADGMPPTAVARRFLESVAEIVEVVCLALRDRSGLDAVALCGDVFQNAILRDRVRQKLEFADFRVYQPGRVPPNDAGLAFGQLAVAAALK